jgi:acyl-coenzyme A synthetase/AMP-(fatty) acid ligase
MEQASTDFKIPETNPEDAALLHFTSGTTGMPKAFYMCIMLFYPLRNR